MCFTLAAMQNLRDKLLKAGLVTEKQAKDAERGQKKPAGTVKQKQEAVSEEERQRRDAFAQREVELAEERRKEAAKRIYEVDKQAVRFWFGPEKPIGFELD